MGCLVAIFFLLAVVFAGVGFAVHLLWILAIIFFVCWIAGFAFARGQRRGSTTALSPPDVAGSPDGTKRRA